MEKNFLTIQDYILAKPSEPFDTLSEVDFAALTALSYVKFENIDTNIIEMRIGELHDSYQKPKKSDLRGMTYYKFFRAFSMSKRYKDIRLLDFTTQESSKEEMQFASVTFLLPNNEIVVSFRGTDSSLSGWKEDANMAYLNVTPSEDMASATLMRLMYTYKDQKFHISGHSKGGRLAIYASSMLPKELQDRIVTILDLDSPGLGEEEYNGEGYLNIIDKIQSFVPNMSVVGLIFRKRQKVTVIKSYAPLILEHDLFYWGVKGNSLEYLKKLDSGEELKEGTFNRVMKVLTPEQMKEFLSLIYSIFQGEDSSLSLLQVIEFKNLIKALKKFVKLSKEEKNQLKDVTNKIIKVALNIDDKNSKKVIRDLKEE